jgi:hypothetical protein
MPPDGTESPQIPAGNPDGFLIFPVNRSACKIAVSRYLWGISGIVKVRKFSEFFVDRLPYIRYYVLV